MTEKNIILVDLTDIPSSDGETALFVNNKHILSSDSNGFMPVKDIADKLSLALGVEIKEIGLEPHEVALGIASRSKNGDSDLNANLKMAKSDGEIEAVYEKWCDSYDNDDIESTLRLLES